MEHDVTMSPWILDEDALENVHQSASARTATGPTRRKDWRYNSAVNLSHLTIAPLFRRENTTLLVNGTLAGNTTLEQARLIVAKAIAESAKRNTARYQSPARNVFRLKPGTVIGGTTVQRRRGGILAREDEADAPPMLLEITDEIANAAALVAEAEAYTAMRANNLTRRQSSAGTFWMQGLARKGTVPWGDDPTYAIFRNVRDYGATGNGITVSQAVPIP